MRAATAFLSFHLHPLLIPTQITEEEEETGVVEERAEAIDAMAETEEATGLTGVDMGVREGTVWETAVVRMEAIGGTGVVMVVLASNSREDKDRDKGREVQIWTGLCGL